MGTPTPFEQEMRLSVWEHSLIECQRLLRLADRVFQMPESDQRDFVGLLNCGLIVDGSRCLAIVFFCQCLHRGNADPGKIMASPRQFDQPPFAAIPVIAFPATVDLEKFEKFCEQILTVRDKAIAHADGSFMAIHETDQGIVGRKSAFFHLMAIDFQYFDAVVEDLLRALQAVRPKGGHQPLANFDGSGISEAA